MTMEATCIQFLKKLLIIHGEKQAEERHSILNQISKWENQWWKLTYKWSLYNDIRNKYTNTNEYSGKSIDMIDEIHDGIAWEMCRDWATSSEKYPNISRYKSDITSTDN